jgi:hypothetical protein
MYASPPTKPAKAGTNCAARPPPTPSKRGQLSGPAPTTPLRRPDTTVLRAGWPALSTAASTWNSGRSKSPAPVAFGTSSTPPNASSGYAWQPPPQRTRPANTREGTRPETPPKPSPPPGVELATRPHPLTNRQIAHKSRKHHAPPACRAFFRKHPRHDQAHGWKPSQRPPPSRSP